MEMLADHYQIPSINFAKRIVELQQAGKLIFKSDMPAPQGMIRFSQDGVHPLDEGHQIYTDVLADAVRQISKAGRPIDHATQLANPFIEDNWEQAKMVPVDSSMLSGDWKQLPAEASLQKSFGNRMGAIWEATQPGSKLSFKFRGSIAKLYDLLGPDGGQVVITVDGKRGAKPIPRFDSYCTYHRIATLPIAEGLDPTMVHEATIEIHPDQPDRSSVAFRLKDPDRELKEPKYQGTAFRCSQILILGDVIKP
jgi:hypothetical protein